MDGGIVVGKDMQGNTVCENCQCGNVEEADDNADNNSDVQDDVTGSVSDSSESDGDDVNSCSKPDCRLIYLKACSLFQVTPSNYFLNHLSDIDVSMHNRTVGDVGVKAIATAMVVCFLFPTIILTCNK